MINNFLTFRNENTCLSPNQQNEHLETLSHSNVNQFLNPDLQQSTSRTNKFISTSREDK